MNVNYINPFIVASKSVLSSMLDIDITIERPRIAPIEFKEDSKVILIGITGEVKGQVFLGFAKPVACKIASAMIGFEVLELDALAESAIAELGNMILGNTATQFSQNNMQIAITPPTVAQGNVRFDTKEVEHIMIPITIAEGMTVELHIALKK